MSTFIYDEDGDSLRITKVHPKDGKPMVRLMTQEDRGDGNRAWAGFGRVDPHELIEAIKRECDLHEDDPIHHRPRSAAHVIDRREAESMLRTRSQGPEIMAEAKALEEEQAPLSSCPDDTADGPCEACAPQENEGAEEDSPRERYIEKHERRGKRYEQRLDVVREAMAMLPATGQRGGLAEGLFGKGGEPQPVEKALKVARFVADGARDIPGVDK